MRGTSNDAPIDLPTWQRPIPDLLPEYRQVAPPIFGHFGVYGVCIERGAVLTIRKARGPYTGLLDLPGGTPEADESHEETLRRELLEETAGTIVAAEPAWHAFAFCVALASDGTRVAYDHRGVFKRVRLSGVAEAGPLTQAQADVAGLHWVSLAGWKRRHDLSSALAAALHVVAGLEPLAAT